MTPSHAVHHHTSSQSGELLEALTAELGYFMVLQTPGSPFCHQQQEAPEHVPEVIFSLAIFIA